MPCAPRGGAGLPTLRDGRPAHGGGGDGSAGRRHRRRGRRRNGGREPRADAVPRVPAAQGGARRCPTPRRPRRDRLSRVQPALGAGGVPRAMREAVAAVGAARPDARCVLALAPTIEPAAVERRLGAGRTVAIARDRAHAVMRAADLLLVASGTATLEAALLGTPMVVC